MEILDSTTIGYLLGDNSPINKDIVSHYENIFGVILPIEVQRVISHEDGNFSYNNKKYWLKSPEKWRDYLDFFGFNFDETDLIPLLEDNDRLVICYDIKEKGYLFKELGLGTETDVYESFMGLLNERDAIIKKCTQDI
jgi:hypothetical protein